MWLYKQKNVHGGFAAHHSKPWSHEKPAALLKIDFPAFNLVTKRLTLTKRIRWQHLQAKGPGCAGERFLLPAEILEPRAQLRGKAWDSSTEWVRKKNRTPQPRASQRMKSPLLLTQGKSRCLSLHRDIAFCPHFTWRAWASLLLCTLSGI